MKRRYRCRTPAGGQSRVPRPRSAKSPPAPIEHERRPAAHALGRRPKQRIGAAPHYHAPPSMLTSSYPSPKRRQGPRRWVPDDVRGLQLHQLDPAVVGFPPPRSRCSPPARPRAARRSPCVRRRCRTRWPGPAVRLAAPRPPPFRTPSAPLPAPAGDRRTPARSWSDHGSDLGSLDCVLDS